MNEFAPIKEQNDAVESKEEFDKEVEFQLDEIMRMLGPEVKLVSAEPITEPAPTAAVENTVSNIFGVPADLVNFFN